MNKDHCILVVCICAIAALVICFAIYGDHRYRGTNAVAIADMVQHGANLIDAACAVYGLSTSYCMIRAAK